MGIDGLLNLVKSITKKQHISSFKNKTIGVDALPWLYKGCYSTPYQSKDDNSSLHFLNCMMGMIDLLSYYNIKPIIVFDGRSLRMKKNTNQKRSNIKQINRQKGLQLLEKGQIQQAKKFLSRCINIDQRIISTAMRALKYKNIDFIVAPYQADTQLAKLKNLNIIDAAISQDSDLLVYGINVLFKLNLDGNCDYVDFQNCNKNDADNQFLKLYLDFSYELKVDSAILAGSDYGQSIHGIGIKRAIKLLHKQQNISNVIKKLRTQKIYKQKIPQNYEQLVNQIKLIFHLATTYNPIKNTLQCLNPSSIEKIKPQSMKIEQLHQLTGQHFDFTQEIKTGLISIRNLTQRNLQPLIFYGDFSANKQVLNLYQQLNKQRRANEQIQRLNRKQNWNIYIQTKIQQKQNQKNNKICEKKVQKQIDSIQQETISKLQMLNSFAQKSYIQIENDQKMGKKKRSKNQKMINKRYLKLYKQRQQQQMSSQQNYSNYAQKQQIDLQMIEKSIKFIYQNLSKMTQSSQS